MKDIMIRDSFISEDFCRLMINDVKVGWLKENNAFHKDMNIKEYLITEKEVDLTIKSKADVILKTYLSNFISDFYGYEYNCSAIIEYKDGVTLPMHLDNPCFKDATGKSYTRSISFLCFLNDDFEGGELIFPEQDVIIKPKAGKIVGFPISHVYPHMVNTVNNGTRYALRINYNKISGVA